MHSNCMFMVHSLISVNTSSLDDWRRIQIVDPLYRLCTKTISTKTRDSAPALYAPGSQHPTQQ